MPILNYTTSIGVHRTCGEIQELLAKAGSKTIVIEYCQDGIPEAILFDIQVGANRLSFRLPSRWSGVHKSLLKSNAEKRFKTEEQARRVAWRIVKDWTEAQIAIIEAGAAELTEVFLPYLVNPNTGLTMYDNFKSEYLLTSGEVVDAD